MPSVLITGLNGFVAVHTAAHFLSQGWTVRGTVRSQAKADTVLQLPHLKKWAEEGKIQTVAVTDLAEGDFSTALDGVDAVAHVASPYHLSGSNWAEYRDPAVKGTTNVLAQAARYPSIKTVSIVSSFAAVVELKPFAEQTGKVYTEADYLPTTEEECEALDTSNPLATVVWYCASKKFAELAAFETHKRTGATYALTSLNPPMIFGPAYHIDSLTTPDVSTSLQMSIVTGGKDGKLPDTSFTGFIDVRDVAKAAYESAARSTTGRFLIFSEMYDFQRYADIARTAYPQYAESIVTGNPGEDLLAAGNYAIDATKSVKELGMTYIPFEQTVKDTVEQFAKLGAYKA